MAECILKVKKELGENAVILDSRKVPRGGPFSFLLNDMVEVIASTEDRHMGAISGRKERREAAMPDYDKFSATEPGGLSQASNHPPRNEKRSEVKAAEFALISDDIKSLKDTVAQITDHLKYQQLPSLPAELEKLHRDLLENGVEDRVASALTAQMTLSLTEADFEDRTLLQHALHERVGKIVRTLGFGTQDASTGKKSPHHESRIQNPKVIALVGPTGVGKTTTLAKLATHPGLYGRRRVALVSADTYRIAAVEQLKTFAAIANIPMEAVYRPSDMRRAIERFSDREVILIDTAGRSQNDRGQLNDLAAFMDYAQPDEVHLVLAINTRLDDQLDVISKFSVAGPKHLIFTKLDETTSYGMILNVCFNLSNREQEPGKRVGNLPVSLMTCGQNVPDDVVPPTPSQMVRLVCERNYYRELTAGQRSVAP